MVNNNIKQAVGVVFLVVLSCLLGCDKLSFLPGSSSKTADVSKSGDVKSQTTAARALAPNELARVGKWTMTIDEFEERLRNLKEVAPDIDINDVESKGLILEELVRQELLVQDAEARGVAKKKDIADAVNEFRRTLLIRDVAQGLTEGIEATEEEARQYYEENKDLFVDQAEWRVREIVTFSESTAKELLIELLKGADFAEMAKTRSSGKTAAKGGDLGYITEPPFPQMGNALANLEVGGVSSVFKGPQGYYIIKLEDKKGGAQKPFSEIKDDLKDSLTVLKQQQAILDHLNMLREKIPIKVNLDLLKAAP